MRLQGKAGAHQSLLGIALLPECVQLARVTGRGAQRGLQLHSERLRAEDGEAAAACGAALKRALDRLPGGGPRRAAMALPDSAVAQCSLELPAGLSEAQRDTALRAEAQGLLPHPVEELCMDYRTLPAMSAAHAATRARSVRLAACRRASLEALQTVAARAGLRLERIDIAGQAQRRGRRLLQQQRIPPGAAGTTALERAAVEISCGLTADEGFNFLPWRRRRRRALCKKFLLAAALIAVTAQLPAAAGAWHLRQTEQSLQAQTQSLERQRRQLLRQDAARQKQQAALAQRRAHSATLRGFYEHSRRLPRLLAAIPALLPEGARLNRLALHGDGLQLWGSADSAAQVTRLLRRMRNHGMRAAELESLRAAEQAPRHDFSLRAQLPETPAP